MQACRVLWLTAAMSAFMLAAAVTTARAEIDGHGPDAWRVSGVAANDVLNGRMGPGTNYRVIETFAHDERGLQLVTCVPLLIMPYYGMLSEAELSALPPRWCLVRSADLGRAGWVAQAYLAPDDDEAAQSLGAGADALIEQAQALIARLFDDAAAARQGGPHPLDLEHALDYFSSEVVAGMRSKPLEADPITVPRTSKEM